MPELPEVETVIRSLKDAHVPGKQFDKVVVSHAKTVAEPTAPNEFCDRLKGRSVVSIERRGKYIVVTLDSDLTLLVHLRMSGRLLFSVLPEQRKHVHVQFRFSDGMELAFYDPRKFGRIWLINDPARILGKLGVEPLGRAFSKNVCRELLAASNREIKALLLDQGVIAGLGNIYCDEALWVAKINPRRRAATLSMDESDRLCDAIKKVLRKGIRNLGTSLGHGQANFKRPAGETGRNKEKLHVYGQEGMQCQRCGSMIMKGVVAQRGTHWCPICQQTD